MNCWLLQCVYFKGSERHGGKNLGWASYLSSWGFSVSSCKMMGRDVIRGPSGSANPRFYLLSFLLDICLYSCFTRKTYFIHVSKDFLPVYLFEFSMKLNLCSMTHDLFYIHQFISFFTPLAHGILAAQGVQQTLRLFSDA